MEYSHRYHAHPTGKVADRLEHHLDVHRQLYNHVRWDYENSPEGDKPSEYDQNNKLPEWKRKWPVFGELHSKAAQATVARFHRNLLNLRKKKEKGYGVGRLKRQSPTDYRSVTYSQSGFDLYGTHVVQVEARGTTKECARCGVETAKPIWVREHSCPSCGFECDRDANAAMNVLQRGFQELGLGWPEATPVETVTATDTADFQCVSASHVVEAGSLPS